MDSSTENDEGKNSNHLSVKLEPFVHQVGGHSSLLCLDESTVCKSMVQREKTFYETMPELLKPFTAQYRGSIEVPLTEDVGGYLTLTVYPPDGCLSLDSKYSRKHKLSWHHRMNVQIESDTNVHKNIFEDDTCTSIQDGSSPKHPVRERKASSHNPWVLHCHRDNIARILGMDTEADSSQQLLLSLEKPASFEFIVLANLTWRRKRPCVLDIKMGTRQYGDDAPESKQRSQTRKVENSTSGSLGIRLCGMQVYQVTTNRYLCRNKYYGRSLNDDGLRSSLVQFFHNGVRLRTEILQPLLDSLNELLTAVNQLSSFRFFTSSLLIIYDGFEPSNGSCCNSCDTLPVSVALPWHQTPPFPLRPIDVRVIDFARATHRDMNHDFPVYSGPDEGFLFGLKNMIALVEELIQSGA